MKKLILLSIAIISVSVTFSQAQYKHKQVAIVREGSVYGAINQKGEYVVEPKYTKMNDFVSWMAVVRQGDYWGAVNLNGEEVLKCEFEKVYDYSEEGIARAAIGLAYVTSHGLDEKRDLGKFVYVNTKGETISKLYEKCYDFQGGAAIVAEDGRDKYYVNTNMEEIIINFNGKQIFPRVYPFSEGVGRVALDGQTGYIDATGKFVLEPIYEDGNDFESGFAPVLKDGKWGVIDRSGNWVVTAEYDDIPQHTGTGKWMVEKKKLGWGIIDQQGNFKPFPEDHKEHHRYIDGYMMAESKKGIGMLNDNGEWCIQPIYVDVKPYEGGLALAVDKSEIWFAIDPSNGKEIRVPEADAVDIGANDIGHLGEGLLAVRTPTNTGFIDVNGNWVIKPTLERISLGEGRGVFVNGVAILEQGGLLGCMDKDGNWVITPKYKKMTGFVAIEETEEQILAKTTLKGYFQYDNLTPDQFAGMKLYLINDAGDTIATTITDATGYFLFEDLPADQNYLVKLAEPVDELDMVVISPLTGKKRAIISQDQAVFMFKFLGGDEPIAMLLMQDEDNTTIAGFFRYQELASDKVGGMKVYLLDDDGKIVMTTTTASDGTFSFKNLDPDKNYLVKIDETDKAVELVMLNEEGESVAVMSPDEGVFEFNYLPSEQTAFLALMEEEDVNIMEGFFAYKNLAADRVDGLKVYLIDDNGNILMTTTTDKDGYFKFKKLDPEVNYFVKIDETDLDMQLVILGDDSESYAAVLSNGKDGMFLYHQLDPEQIAGLGMLYTVDGEMADGQLTKSFMGQFRFKYLDSDSIAGLVVHLVDDEGNIVFTTTTDENGMFAFRNLPFEQNYLVKLDEPNGDIELLVINTDGVAAEMSTNNKGEFVFMKLAKMAVASLTEMDSGDIALHSTKSSVMAQFKYKFKESFVARTTVKVKDKLGKLVGAGTTDEKGRVYFNHFSQGDDVVFELIRAEDDTAMVMMDLYNSEDKKITSVASADGKFGYEFLEGDIPFDPLFLSDEDMAKMAAMAKGEVMVKKLTEDVFVIYFGLNSDQYGYEGQQQLDELLKTLKDHEKLTMDITAYSDKSGTQEYNLELSQRRAKSVVEYLTNNGIAKNRIISRGLGATNFAVECEDCTEQQHQLNRRAVLRIQ